MNFLSRLSLRSLLVTPYMVLITVLVLVIGWLFYHTSRDAVDDWSGQLLTETVERIKLAVDKHVSGSTEVLETAVPQGWSPPVFSGEKLAGIRERFWLAASVHHDPNDYVYYGDVEGRFIGLKRLEGEAVELRLRDDTERPRRIYNYSGPRAPLGNYVEEKRIFDPRERPWFKAGIRRDGHAWSPIYIDFKTFELVSTRVRRVNDADGRLAGVVATDMSLNQINMFLRSLSLSNNGVAMVVELDGSLVGVSRGDHLRLLEDGSHDRLNALDSPEPLVAGAFAAIADQLPPRGVNASLTTAFKDRDGRPVQLGYSRLQDAAGMDWLVMVAIPRNDYLGGFEDSVKQSLILALVAALCVVLLGFGTLSVITHELRKLALYAWQIGEGNYNTGLYTERDDEIGQLVRSIDEMQHRLLTDQLTGVANRVAVNRRIEERISSCRRRGDDRPFFVLFTDLNDFKTVNDTYGHDVGDIVLCEFAKRIRESLRTDDLIARYAGDEFIILLDNIEFREDAETVRRHLAEALNAPLLIRDGQELVVAAAVGIARYPDDGRDVDSLIRAADQDMYGHKSLRGSGKS
ncbi:diguanylate cyclase [Granulosicoccaceae sp. 1_MG-2023]|nr:diguanylate cyclase [Granulosicoccaceae sp. 1_MG-2023]